VPVERNRIVVLRINNKYERLQITFDNPQRRIGEQCAAESAALKALVDREPPTSAARNDAYRGRRLRMSGGRSLDCTLVAASV
jgi:hypothetical protein